MNQDTGARPPVAPEEQEQLLAELRQLWLQVDPMPPDLVDRVLFALELEQLDLTELTMQADLVGSGARGDEVARTITFASPTLTVMVTVQPQEAGVRLDGWIAEPGVRAVLLRSAEGEQRLVSDELGRFVVAQVARGRVQLAFPPTGPEQGPARPATVVTPPFEL